MNSTHDPYGIFTADELYLEVIQNAGVQNEPETSQYLPKITQTAAG